MPRREQKRLPAKKQEKTQPEVEAQVDEEAERLKAETDRLLEEIDEALGENLENAQEFMANWIQKGGQ